MYYAILTFRCVLIYDETFYTIFMRDNTNYMYCGPLITENVNK